MTTTNIDSKIVAAQQDQIVNEQAPVQPVPEIGHDEQPVFQAEEPIVNEVHESAEEAPKENDSKLEKESTSDSPIDEYGNPVEKPRMYSEEEVQRMIRDRLSRGKHAEQPTPQEVQQVKKDFTPDPDSEESWEQQLEQFVEKTIDKRQQKLSEQQWRQQEQAIQSEFEEKFTTGMSKYQDFHQVVSGKPITDGIMMAARGLDNPAAFIYGASKLHPGELDRISRIPDRYQQAAEVGRLHERMVKARNAASKASKPLDTPKGDVPSKHIEKPSIESRINQYAKQKLNRR